MELESIRQAFIKKGYECTVFDTAKEAADYLDGALDGKTIGFGDSMTLYHMGLYELLASHNTVHSPMHLADGRTFDDEAFAAMDADVFMVSANAATTDGVLVNIDSYGNRIAGSVYRHEKVYFVVGINKFADTIETAVWRARNIAAPRNAKRLGYKTPCAVNGDQCYDCSASGRICNGMLIHLHKMEGTEMEVVLIGESCGL